MSANIPNRATEEMTEAMANFRFPIPPADPVSTSRRGSGGGSPRISGTAYTSPEDLIGLPQYYPNGNTNATNANNAPSIATAMGLPAPNHNHSQAGSQNSRTWRSEDAKDMQEFIVYRNAMRRLFKDSPFAKQWKFADYINHREAVLTSNKARIEGKVRAVEEDRAHRAAHPISEEAFAYARQMGASVISRLHFHGNVSLVLGLPTVFCMNWTDGKDEIAPWPSVKEMKWEGDDRSNTSVGRYLPLPREPGAPGIAWGQLLVIPQYPLDQMRKIPTLEDLYLPVDNIEEDRKYEFITKDLDEYINEFGSQ